MPSLSVIKTLCREIVTRERSPRINEPDLVMDDPEKVAAYTEAGREAGVMAPVYLYHCAQMCEVIHPGDTVIDLGCGPATQLAMAARLNPDAHFIGLDLSPDMLDRARTYVDEQGLENVELRTQDITALTSLSDYSVDAVVSTVALHHLPDFAALEKTFSEVSRVLKPGGGVYMVDFGHLKSEKSIHDFAYQYADRQPELFTLDYLYSLKAAFTKQEFTRLTRQYLQGSAQTYSTFMSPFMVAVKSPSHADACASGILRQLHEIRDNLPSHHKADLADLITFFKMGGLRSPLLA